MSCSTPSKIIHIDMDAFFASVEQLDNAEFRGKPVIVGGDPRSRGVVAAASYEARRHGIRSAMSTSQAYRLCPHAIFVRPNFKRYVEVSKQLRAIFYEATDLVQPLSLDEAFLDVTQNKFNEPSAQKIAYYLKSRILGSLGLTASAGVSSVMFVAKIASDLRKPNGLVVIPPEQVDSFVGKLPVDKLWGVGPVTAKKLHAKGMMNANDIRQRSMGDLQCLLGKQGVFIYKLAMGIDERKVSSDRQVKSRGVEETFAQDILNIDKIIGVINRQAEEVANSLYDKLQIKGKTITLKIRYDDFTSITRSRTLSDYTWDANEIAKVAIDLLIKDTAAHERPVRLVGISVSNLETMDSSESVQLPLPFY